MQTAKTLIRLGGCPGWSESLLGAHAILVLSWGGLFLPKSALSTYLHSWDEIFFLQLIHDQEVKDLTKRMEAESKEQMRQLAKKHKDKQAISR